MSIQMKRIPTDASTCRAVVSDIRIEAKCHNGGINLEVRYSEKLLPTLEWHANEREPLHC